MHTAIGDVLSICRPLNHGRIYGHANTVQSKNSSGTLRLPIPLWINVFFFLRFSIIVVSIVHDRANYAVVHITATRLIVLRIKYYLQRNNTSNRHNTDRIPNIIDYYRSAKCMLSKPNTKVWVYRNWLTDNRRRDPVVNIVRKNIIHGSSPKTHTLRYRLFFFLTILVQGNPWQGMRDEQSVRYRVYVSTICHS